MAEHFCASRKWAGDLRRICGPPAVIKHRRRATCQAFSFFTRGLEAMGRVPFSNQLQGVYMTVKIYGANLWGMIGDVCSLIEPIPLINTKNP